MDARSHHVERRGIETTFRDDHIRVALGRLDKFQVHRSYGQLVLPDHGFGSAAPFGDIALQPTDETDVRIGIDEDLYIKKVTQCGIHEDQDTFDQDYPAWRHDKGRGRAAVRGKIIDRY